MDVTFEQVQQVVEESCAKGRQRFELKIDRATARRYIRATNREEYLNRGHSRHAHRGRNGGYDANYTTSLEQLRSSWPSEVGERRAHTQMFGAGNTNVAVSSDVSYTADDFDGLWARAGGFQCQIKGDMLMWQRGDSERIQRPQGSIVYRSEIGRMNNNYNIEWTDGEVWTRLSKACEQEEPQLYSSTAKADGAPSESAGVDVRSICAGGIDTRESGSDGEDEGKWREAKVLADFDSREYNHGADEYISLQKGDVISIRLGVAQAGWAYGANQFKAGWFPESFVEVECPMGGTKQ